MNKFKNINKFNFKMIAVTVVLIMWLVAIACVRFLGYYYDYKGIMSGFDYKGSGHVGEVVAVGSNLTEFDIDAVTLDYFFGWLDARDTTDTLKNRLEGEQFRCVYFNTYEKSYSIPDWPKEFKNYEDFSERWYFLERIESDTFNSDEYRVIRNRQHGKKFNHKQTLTIPKQLFISPVGYINLQILNIYTNGVDSLYSTWGGGGVQLKYEKIDNKIKLSTR